MTIRNKILVLGASSFVGKHLVLRLGTDQVIPTYYTNPFPNAIFFDALAMDLGEVLESPETISHAVILLGVSKPDAAAADIEKSDRLNVTGIKGVIDYLNHWGIKPIYASTESVFDGLKGNYTEADPVNPILTYGRQKVEIENYLRERCSEFLIVRLALVFGADPEDGTLFTRWLEAIKQGETIYCAHDLVSCPVHVGDVAEAIARLIDLDLNGIFHVSSQVPMSRLELFQNLLAKLKQRNPVEVDMVPCSIHDLNLKEQRPLNSSLNPGKLIKATGIPLMSIDEFCQCLVQKF